MFEAIDAAISVALNAGVGSSPGFDSLVFQVSQNHLLKCAPPVTAVWFLWWTRQQAADRDRRQAALLMVLAACFLTMGIVRALTRLLPFRLRPIFETELHLVKAAGMWLGNFDRASSMPSDHAGLFFALAVGLFIVSRPVGILALLHAALMIALPRVYLGLHYASDVLVGAAIGALSAWLLTRPPAIDAAGAMAQGWVKRQPQIAYPVLFLVTSEMAEMFEPLRNIGVWLREMAAR